MTSMTAVEDELDLFLKLVPTRMRDELVKRKGVRELVEVVMDLGRRPIARFPDGDWVISDEVVGLEDLQHAVSKVGDFSDDNRSGINHSLHRISAIRNRKMQIIGLTCRVGRAITGNAEMIHDLVERGDSILVIGRPGVGKTTLIREIARLLADDHMKRVVIVDTSNEIGGDGDVPHSGIGRARRMQVPNVNLQHSVMIEAVENHMPEVIVIDEIGTELEALASSTIAQRGVQLVATAHGVTIESIMKNPSLQILVGGIESVTLGDEVAKKRKVQKTVLERKGPPTFSCAIEMVSKTECRVHHRLEATVDALLAGKSPLFEIRRMNSSTTDNNMSSVSELRQDEDPLMSCNGDDIHHEEPPPDSFDSAAEYVMSRTDSRSSSNKDNKPILVYLFKILEADLHQVAEVMGLENEIDATENIGQANAILALNFELKQNPWIRSVAKFHNLQVFAIKRNTMAQMVKAIHMIIGTETFGSISKESANNSPRDIDIEDDAPKRKPSLEEIDALEEARLAIEYIVIPGGEAVELLPRCSEIVALQLKLVESYQLAAEKSGSEFTSRLHILPLKQNKRNPSLKATTTTTTGGNGGASVTRLPFLPE